MAKTNKRKKTTHEPAAWPQVPAYPGDDIVASVPWLEFGKLTVGNPTIKTDPAGWASVAADWLEEHGQAGLAAVWRHWGLCWTRVDPSGAGSTGDALSERAVGHLGYTGCSLWIDPIPGDPRIYVLLSNRVHPTRDNDAIRPFRIAFHRAAVALVDE